jgi:hypothetical protein
MKHIETNFLIYDLAKQAKYVKGVSLFKFFFAIFALSGLFIMLYLLSSDFRPDLAQVFRFDQFNIFNIQLAVFSVSCLLGPYLAFKLSVPGQEFRMPVKLASIAFYFIWLVFATVMGIMAYNAYQADPNIVWYEDCVYRALLGMSFPMLVLFYYVRKGYILYTLKTAVLLTLTAFGFAGFINLFICPEHNAMHIICSHYSVTLPACMVFILLVHFAKK